MYNPSRVARNDTPNPRALQPLTAQDRVQVGVGALMLAAGNLFGMAFITGNIAWTAVGLLFLKLVSKCHHEIEEKCRVQYLIFCSGGMVAAFFTYVLSIGKIYWNGAFPLSFFLFIVCMMVSISAFVTGGLVVHGISSPFFRKKGTITVLGCQKEHVK